MFHERDRIRELAEPIGKFGQSNPLPEPWQGVIMNALSNEPNIVLVMVGRAAALKNTSSAEVHSGLKSLIIAGTVLVDTPTHPPRPSPSCLGVALRAVTSAAS